MRYPPSLEIKEIGVMSTVLPPILLLFDSSALLSGKTREWQLFGRVGGCFVPRVVLQELDFLRDRATDSSVESTAREFGRFFPESGWRQTSSIASHPLLKPAEGHTLSNRARVSLAVAQTAYGLARNHPDSLVVLVANDQSLLQKVRMLDIHNLCGIPQPVFMLWMRTQRRPPAVAQQLQVMRTMSGAVTPVGASSRGRTSAVARSPVTNRSTTASRSTLNRGSASPVNATKSSTAKSSKYAPQRRPPRRTISFGQIISQLVTLIVLVTLGLAAWRIIDPIRFNKFWDQLPISQQRTQRR